MNLQRTLNYVAFPILLFAAYKSMYWVWGLLFIWWLVPSIKSGQANLMFDIHREEDPILFWAVVALWALTGAMMVATLLFPAYTSWLV